MGRWIYVIVFSLPRKRRKCIYDARFHSMTMQFPEYHLHHLLLTLTYISQKFIFVTLLLPAKIYFLTLFPIIRAAFNPSISVFLFIPRSTCLTGSYTLRYSQQYALQLCKLCSATYMTMFYGLSIFSLMPRLSLFSFRISSSNENP